MVHNRLKCWKNERAMWLESAVGANGSSFQAVTPSVPADSQHVPQKHV